MKYTSEAGVLMKIKRGEGYLITDTSNIRYLSGFHGTSAQVLLTRKKIYLLTDPRYFREAKKNLPKNMTAVKVTKSFADSLDRIIGKDKIRIVFFEEKATSYRQYGQLKKTLKKVSLKPQSDLVENLRMEKSPREIRVITRAQRITEKIFLEMRKNLKAGKTELQIAQEIMGLAYEYGADEVSFPPIIAFGSNSGVPHHLSGERKLKKGDVILVDIGMKYKGYCSDMTRMIFTAKPTPLQEKIYNTVLAAQESAIKKLKAGVKGTDADGFARSIIKKAGYGGNFNHSLGHGVGLQIHELPSLSNHFGQPIPDRSVVTVEPGIYLEKSFGVRIEDMVLVKGKKAQIITKIPKSIKECIVKIN
jgi:Xaa-Pro aminopeptidase